MDHVHYYDMFVDFLNEMWDMVDSGRKTKRNSFNLRRAKYNCIQYLYK